MRLIDADTIEKENAYFWNKEFVDQKYSDTLADLVNAAQTVDAVPVVHGEWINVNEGRWNTIAVYKCSICGEFDSRLYGNENYCLNCGAKMDGSVNSG